MPNLVKNCSFDYVPPFVAATSASGRWIDGTAAGSTTTSKFWWATLNGTTAGSYSAMFDSAESQSGRHSLKLSISSAGSAIDVCHSPSLTGTNISKYGIAVIPNVSYKLTFWMKTNYSAGDSSDGAYVSADERDASGLNITSHFTTKVKATTNWTKYTVDFLAAAGTRYIFIRLKLVGNTGAGSLVMDAWFDNMSLSYTTSFKRKMITNRYKLIPGNIRGHVVELDNGDLLRASLYDQLVQKSTDGGRHWTLKYTLPANKGIRFIWLMKDGTLFAPMLDRANGLTMAQLLRSQDSGETWSSVLTPEANALWYVSEDSHGNYYTNEYSALVGGEETQARNVWRSTDGGTTWSKFWTAPSNARHLHLCAIDKYDNIYVSFGDFDGRATYRLDSQGNIVDTLSTNDGYTSFAEIDGIMYFGNDIVNARIWKYNPLTKNQLSVLDITSHFGAQFEENMLSAQSANGILYFAERGGERTPVNRSYAPNIFVSKDRGARWEMIDARVNKSMNSEQNGIRAITLNPKRSKLFIEYSNYNYRYIDLS